MEIPTETCTHDLKKKMLIYSFISLSSYANFGLSVMVVSFCCFSMQT